MDPYEQIGQPFGAAQEDDAEAEASALPEEEEPEDAAHVEWAGYI